MTLTILEHKSAYYGPRTYENAHAADVTIAIAVDYSTAGEKLTHKAAGEKYLDLRFNALDNTQLARKLYLHMKRNNCKSVNVAGNGIYTLRKHGLTQDYMNEMLYEILTLVHLHWPIASVRSGGQTGVDIAGGVAGVALGIPTTLLLPKGFLQRHEDGVDIQHTENEIREQVMEGVARLKLK